MCKKEKYSILIIGLIAVSGIFAVLYSTRWGAGINSDSIGYIELARNLSNGLGFGRLSFDGNFIPMKHWTPLFPAALSAFLLLDIDPANAARWLNAILFGANILLVGLIINKFTCSVRMAVFGSLLMMLSDSSLNIHSMALTEPLFVFFVLSGFSLLACYIEDPKPLTLISAAGAIAMASLARWAGMPFILSGTLGVLFFSKKPYRKRIIDTSVFAVVSFLPIALFMMRNLLLTGSTSDAHIYFHPVAMNHLKNMLKTFSHWSLLPEQIPLMIMILFLIMLAIGSLAFFNKKICGGNFTNEYLNKFMQLLAMSIIIYMVFIIVCISLADASIPLDYRILIPVYVLGMIFIVCGGYQLVRPAAEQNRVIKAASIALCVIFAGCYLIRGTQQIVYNHNEGQEYASRVWKESEIIRKVKELPRGIIIYTNGKDAVSFLAGRRALIIPEKVKRRNLKVNSKYSSEMAIMKERMKKNNGVLVYFDRITWRWYLPQISELEKQMPLKLVTKCADGAIYKIE
jgi:hypothetical protein